MQACIIICSLLLCSVLLATAQNVQFAHVRGVSAFVPLFSDEPTKVPTSPIDILMKYNINGGPLSTANSLIPCPLSYAHSSAYQAIPMLTDSMTFEIESVARMMSPTANATAFLDYNVTVSPNKFYTMVQAGNWMGTEVPFAV